MKILLLFLLLPVVLAAQVDSTALPAPSLTARTWEQLAEDMEHLFYEGNYSLALNYAQAALSVARRDSGEMSLCYGTSLDNLGVMLHHTGKLAEALPMLEAGVAHGRKYLGVNHEDYVTRLSNLGMLYRDLGYRAKALTTLEEAVMRGEKVLEGAQEDYGILLNNLGLVSEESGLFDNALHHYERALDVTARSSGTKSSRYATRLNNLAALHFRLRQYDLALTLYRQAYAINVAQLGNKHPKTLITAGNIANAQAGMLQYDSARINYLRLLPTMDSVYGHTNLNYLSTITQLSKAYLGLQQPEEALRRLLPTFETYRRLYPGKVESASGCAFYLAQAYEQLNRPAEMTHWALQYFALKQQEIQEEQVQLSETEQQASFNANSMLDAALFSSLLLRHPSDTALCDAGFDAQLAFKGLILGNTQAMLRSFRDHPDTALQHQFLDWQTVKKKIAQQYGLSPAHRLPAFDSLLQQAELLERTLAQQSAQFRSARRKVTWRDVQAKLQPGEAAIEFANFPYLAKQEVNTAGDSTLYVAWLLRPGDACPVPIFLFEEQQLGNLKAVRDLYRPGGRLQTLVWEPLAAALKSSGTGAEQKIHTLYLAPSGLLHQINFGAIPTSLAAEGATLFDRFTLHMLGSTRQLVEPAAPSKTNLPETALVVGGVRYNADSLSLATSNIALTAYPNGYLLRSNPANSTASRAYRGGPWDYLPWTEKEANSVSGYLQKAGAHISLCKGTDASEGAFKRLADHSEVIHLATHGYFFARADKNAPNGFQSATNPLIRSGLLLAGANRVWLGDEPLAGQEDGILTAYEIAQMDLKGVQLVVLSACETGRGDVQAYEGVYGLQRAFKMAGAHYVLMSLWQVDDHATQEFMDALYAGWLRQGLTIPEAYRQAQRQLRARYTQPFSPLLWAGFILLE